MFDSALFDSAIGEALLDVDGCGSLDEPGADSTLPVALDAPSDGPSGGRTCCDKSFTLLCTDFRRFGALVLGDGSGFDRLQFKNSQSNWPQKNGQIKHLLGAGLF